MKQTKPQTNKVISRPKTLDGVVVSTKMKDTIVVSVKRLVKHGRYGKYFSRSKNYKAHDAGNTRKEGEKVTIVEIRPMSKGKNFKVVA